MAFLNEELFNGAGIPSLHLINKKSITEKRLIASITYRNYETFNYWCLKLIAFTTVALLFNVFNTSSLLKPWRALRFSLRPLMGS